MSTYESRGSSYGSITEDRVVDPTRNGVDEWRRGSLLVEQEQACTIAGTM